MDFGDILTELIDTQTKDLGFMLAGKVISINPLKVDIGYQVIDTQYLFLGAMCKETWIPKRYIDEKTHTHEGVHGTTSAEISQIKKIMLWRGLRVGDKVLLFKFNKGQMYYIAQREEGCQCDEYIDKEWGEPSG